MTRRSAGRTPAALTAARILLPLALAGAVLFIFSNSMEVADASAISSGRVLAWMQAGLSRLGLEQTAQRLTMHFVRKLAHFLEYTLEGFLMMLCMRVYTRRSLRYLSWPMLAGLLTALTDETIQLYSAGRSGQVQDVWLDFMGVMAGITMALVLLAVIHVVITHYKNRKKDGLS